MLRVRGVLLEVRACDADALRAGRRGDLEPAFDVQRQVVLRDLVALWQVRGHVVLAVELLMRGDLAVEREAGDHPELDPALFRARKSARPAEPNRADQGVRGGPEPCDRAPAKH